MPPLQITVPAGGITEGELFPLLGVTAREVYPLMGDIIVHPRDYRYPARPAFATHYFTPAGVATLARHLGRAAIVVDATAPAPLAAPPEGTLGGPRHLHSKRWDLEDRP